MVRVDRNSSLLHEFDIIWHGMRRIPIKLISLCTLAAAVILFNKILPPFLWRYLKRKTDENDKQFRLGMKQMLLAHACFSWIRLEWLKPLAKSRIKHRNAVLKQTKQTKILALILNWHCFYLTMNTSFLFVRQEGLFFCEIFKTHLLFQFHLKLWKMAGNFEGKISKSWLDFNGFSSLRDPKWVWMDAKILCEKRPKMNFLFFNIFFFSNPRKKCVRI